MPEKLWEVPLCFVLGMLYLPGVHIYTKYKRSVPGEPLADFEPQFSHHKKSKTLLCFL